MLPSPNSLLILLLWILQKSTYLPPPIPSPHSTTSSILSKLSYDLPTHAPESLDWLNILNAQMLSSYRNLILQSKTGNGGAKGLMEEILNRASGNESTGSTGGEGVDGEGDGGAGGGLIGVDRIRVGEVELGDKFPILSNARVRPSSSEDGAVVRYFSRFSFHFITNPIYVCLGAHRE